MSLAKRPESEYRVSSPASANSLDRDYLADLASRPGAAVVVVSLWDSAGGCDEVGRIPIDGASPEDVVDQVVQVAHTATVESHGRQRMRADVLDRDAYKIGMCPFSVEGGGAGDAGLSERPDTQGIVAQTMRHNEVLQKTLMDLQRASVGQLALDNRRLSMRIEKLEAEREANMELKEKLLSQQHARELATETERFKREQWGGWLDMVKVALPAIVNKVAGKPIVTQKLSDVELTAFEFARRLTTKDLDKFAEASGLSTADRLSLITFVESVTKRMRLVTEDEQGENNQRIKDLLFNIVGASGADANGKGTH